MENKEYTNEEYYVSSSEADKQTIAFFNRIEEILA